ncbi:hypothetical protein V6N13_134718 [Hibiscus sabdariffa]
MEKKLDFFFGLKDEVDRGLSLSPSQSNNPARARSPMTALAPLMEGPDSDGGEVEDSKRVGSGLGQWVKGQLSKTPSVASMNCKRFDLRLLKGNLHYFPIPLFSKDELGLGFC